MYTNERIRHAREFERARFARKLLEPIVQTQTSDHGIYCTCNEYADLIRHAYATDQLSGREVLCEHAIAYARKENLPLVLPELRWCDVNTGEITDILVEIDDDEFHVNEDLSWDPQFVLFYEVGPDRTPEVCGWSFPENRTGSAISQKQRELLSYPLKHWELVITGDLRKSVGYTRDEIQQILEERQFFLHPRVTQRSTAVVIGDNPGATKVRQARELLKPTLDWAGFNALVTRRSLDLQDHNGIRYIANIQARGQLAPPL